MQGSNISVRGIPFSNISWLGLLQSIQCGIQDRKSQYISITNTELLYYALQDAGLGEYVKSAAFSCCDGVGVAIAAKLAGFDIPRLNGPDLMLKCCEFGQQYGWRHYFYGGKEGVPDILIENLKERFPDMIVTGCCSPPFRPLSVEEDEDIAKMINETKPDFVWVGLGLPKQERWIASHLNRINAPWMVGVGAAFDFYAGTVKRAPAIFQKCGFEWLYRVIFEPRMLIRHVRSFKLFFSLLADRKSIGNV